ncbi:MAG TPA: helix-turn-helix transcriptional regulator [Burkholderiaceae bacterium]|nr:helix-turn-helix transcriptional regulator [Burkholderiaceae bacterium]
METFADFSSVAYLLADPSRAIMLAALLDGRALPAGELAHAAGITAQTASAHLSKLLEGGLLACESEGRHRYYRLAGPDVAQALEHLAVLSGSVRRKPLGTEGTTLRQARCCYDHLAGRLGVVITQSLVGHAYIVPIDGKQYEITSDGMEWFESLGIKGLQPSRRGLARQCLDWTERAHHVAGPLGSGLLRALCDLGWLRRSRSSRLVQVTPEGHAGLKAQLGVDVS